MDIFTQAGRINRFLSPSQVTTDVAIESFGIYLILLSFITVIILACAIACAKWSRDHPLNPDSVSQESIIIEGNQDDYITDNEEYTDKTNTQIVSIPSRCPNCGISISQDDLIWIGPLLGKCPSCEATIRGSVDKI
ncbi:MAG: hypothetical protein ACFFF4_06010 [Candidatus Thorarchaeota archaeon]